MIGDYISKKRFSMIDVLIIGVLAQILDGILHWIF